MPTLAKGEKKFPSHQNPLDALVMARALIEKPENWTQREWGINGKHCMFGALSRSTSHGLDTFTVALDYLRAEIPHGMPAPKFNDSSSHADVIAAYDRAIAKASEHYTLTPWPLAPPAGDPAHNPSSTA